MQILTSSTTRGGEKPDFRPANFLVVGYLRRSWARIRAKRTQKTDTALFLCIFARICTHTQQTMNELMNEADCARFYTEFLTLHAVPANRDKSIFVTERWKRSIEGLRKTWGWCSGRWTTKGLMQCNCWPNGFHKWRIKVVYLKTAHIFCMHWVHTSIPNKRLDT